MIINIADDFSQFPGGRYYSDGEWSGEQFRETLLVPKLRSAIQKRALLTIDTDGVMGLPSSFLEEAFGGLIRSGFTLNEFGDYVYIKPHASGYSYFAKIFTFVYKAWERKIQQEMSTNNLDTTNYRLPQPWMSHKPQNQQGKNGEGRNFTLPSNDGVGYVDNSRMIGAAAAKTN